MAYHRGAKIRAQSVSEYSIFLAIALIAILVMNVYVKRGLQGRYVDVANLPARAINSQVVSAQGAGNIPADYVLPQQYEPYYVDSTSNITMEGRSMSQTVTKGGKRKRDILPGAPTLVTGTNVEGADAD